LEGIAPDPGPMVPCPVAVEVVEMSLEGRRVRLECFVRGQAMKGRGGEDEIARKKCERRKEERREKDWGEKMKTECRD
jgi:hypothetical protein